MKKQFKGLLLAVFGLTAMAGLASCSGSTEGFDTTKEITRYTRDTTSGTREGFFEKIGFTEAQKDSTKIPGSVEVSGNGTMLSSVKGDEYGIGYASLASIDSELKALSFEGVEATEENVVNGTYKLTRNFNYIIRTEEDMTETEKALVKGFVLYMGSKEGLGIVVDNDGILDASKSISSAESWSDIIEKVENADVKAACGASTKTTIYFGGSTSVEKMSKALTEAFAKVCTGFEASHNHTGSGDAYKRTQGSDKDSQNKLHIGFLSRDVKLSSDEPAAENTYGQICIDGIAVIVNKQNTAVNNLTAAQLKSIYATDHIRWNEIA